MEYDKNRLSEKMLADVLNFEKTGEDAIYWLGKGVLKNTDEIITRIQSSHIGEVCLSGLKTIEEWKNSNSPLNEVRASLCPVSSTNKYSSYALKESDFSMGALRYPLFNTFASKNILFSTKTFPKYYDLLNRIKREYKIKIVEQSSKGELFSYKRRGRVTAMLKNTGLRALNLCKKLFKRETFSINPSYKGKIVIRDTYTYNNGNAYKFSQQEKFTKILDAIVNIETKHQNKKLKAKLSKDEQFFARLYSEVLLSRAINYGDVESNKNVESSLTLQMSNVLARLDMAPEQIANASKVGVKVAMQTINKLGLTLTDVRNSFIGSGYKYKIEPVTIEDALLAKQAPVNEVAKEEKEPVNKKNAEEKEIVNKKVEETNPNKKFDTAKNFVGVKDGKVYLTLNSAKKYIDNVVKNALKKQIKYSVNNIYDKELSERKEKKMQRQYNFVEHMLSFYDTHKDVDVENLNQMVEKELKNPNLIKERNYAHSFSKSFIDFRAYIIEQIFGNEEKIEKKDGKAISTLINDLVQKEYGKKLSSYVLEKVKKGTAQMFKDIDSQNFKPIDLVEQTSDEVEQNINEQKQPDVQLTQEVEQKEQNVEIIEK